jgi:hypothetical protein
LPRPEGKLVRLIPMRLLLSNLVEIIWIQNSFDLFVLIILFLLLYGTLPQKFILLNLLLKIVLVLSNPFPWYVIVHTYFGGVK